MKASRQTGRGLDSLLCLFLPFLIGLVLARVACSTSGSPLFFCAAILLLLLVPSSVYGPLLSFSAFVLFGLCLGTVLGERGRSETWTVALVLSRAGLYLWIPVLYCLGQYGLNGSARLRLGKDALRGTPLRRCLHTTLVQLLALLTAALLSRWLTGLG